MEHVLIIDDDIDLSQLLKEYLEAEGLQVSQCFDGQSGSVAAVADGLDIVILDVMMPGLDGIATLRKIRESSSVPVLMLTAKGDDVDRIVGLELGADDYVPKPCTPRELLARVRAILRRYHANDSNSNKNEPIEAGKLIVWPAKRRAQFNGEILSLTGAEFGLLETLAANAGEVVSKETLSAKGLGRPLARYYRSVDVHISSIRQKLGKRGDDSSWIQTVRGQGYLLVLE
ncbi:MAG: response regulator transcription factor [Burkholderiaceae bacterium]